MSIINAHHVIRILWISVLCIVKQRTPTSIYTMIFAVALTVIWQNTYATSLHRCFYGLRKLHPRLLPMQQLIKQR